MASPDDNDPVRSELEYAPPWVREQAQREQAAREQEAPSGREQESREQEAREGARDQTAREQTPREHITRDQFRAALRQSGAGPLDPLLQNELHNELNPRSQTFGDDRPWHQRALEPELVPEPPTEASGLGPIMLRMGAVCAIAAMVAGAVVFLFSPKQAVHKIAQANVSAPAIADIAPGAIEAPRGIPALTVEPAAGASIPLPAPDRVASATPVQLPQPETATAPPQAPAISPPPQPDSPAAPAPQIASLPTASPAELRPSTAPAVNEPAPAEANPGAKPAPPPPSGPAQAVPPSVPKPAVVLDQNEIMTLIRRGKALLNDGDFAAARVLFERAANAGSAEAALALGSTYDPNVIRRLGAMMVKPDIESARKWYQLAADRGSAAASLQLANLPQGR